MLAYGVPIKVPHDPDWDIMLSRLTNFQSDSPGRDRLDEEEASAGVPKQIAKSAKLETPSILISAKEENGEDNFDDSFHDIESVANGAIEKILGKDHGFVLKPYRAATGYVEYDGFNAVRPVVFLFTKECTSDRQDEPDVKWHDVIIPPMSEEEKADIDGKIGRILSAFSLEAESSPGWKLVLSNSCEPR
jgi:hypothetical protein